MDTLSFLFRPRPAGRLFGIPILVMPAVVVLTVLVLLLAGGRGGAPSALWTFSVLLVLAASLLAHELGHALVARRLRVEVLDITIWPLGGMARMEGLSDRPGLEGAIAVAGPLVNLVLAGLFHLVPGSIAFLVVWVNFVLGAGNLIPVFPLDGGRVLRAFLARHAPIADATRAAVRLGGWLNLALLGAFFLADSPFLGLIFSLYLWGMGRMEIFQVVLRTGQFPVLPVGEVVRRAFAGLGPPTRGEPGAPEEPPTGMKENLEHFRGSLDEFFRRGRPPL
ncbi:MAG: M50 family metallopeptidase [Planctomycetota bacterium]